MLRLTSVSVLHSTWPMALRGQPARSRLVDRDHPRYGPVLRLGAFAGDVARCSDVLSGEADAGTWTLRVVGIAATVASVWLVGRAAQRALKAAQPSD